jgi:formate dehydrogenase subunit gamma
MSEVAGNLSDPLQTVNDAASGLADKPGALLPILHEIQEALGYIPAEVVPRIAELLNLSRAEVHGVISFYHYFRSSPPGRHVVQICRAESCRATGGIELEQHARQTLNIDFNQTTPDGQITLSPVFCLGNCACSPSVRVGDAIHSHMDPEKFDQLLDELAKSPVEVK